MSGRRHRLVAVLVPMVLSAPGPVGQAAADPGPVGHDNGEAHACTGVQPGTPAVLCVRAGAPPGGDGSAAAPLATIQAALLAARAGDIIQVAAGTYPENLALGAFNAPTPRHLRLLGGFAADFSARDAGNHPAVVDGGGLAPAVQMHLSGSGESVLDGFRITGGVGLGSSWQDGYGHGGGVYVVLEGPGRVTVSHNAIHGNRTRHHTTLDSRGGGIHARNQSGGTAAGEVRIEHNHVFDNLAGKGAGIHVAGRQAALVHNRVQDNIAHNDHGGGIYVSTAGTELRGNRVQGNRVGATVGYGWGGGLLVAAAQADLQGNLFTGNQAPTAGAGVFWDEGAVGTMRNDLVVGNGCPSGNRSAAAIYVDGGPGGPSAVTLESTTVAGHLCPDTEPGGAAIVVEAGSTLQVRNSIVWGNSREFATLSGGSHAVSWSISQQPGTGNFWADPAFADAAAGDYHLRSTAGRHTPSGWVHDDLDSPAIDAGDPAAPFAAETQPNGGRINLGAYGNTAQASRSGAGDGIFADGFQ